MSFSSFSWRLLELLLMLDRYQISRTTLPVSSMKLLWEMYMIYQWSSFLASIVWFYTKCRFQFSINRNILRNELPYLNAKWAQLQFSKGNKHFFIYINRGKQISILKNQPLLALAQSQFIEICLFHIQSKRKRISLYT